ncbi:hypothetical protein QBC39DRAFT_15633 [Podospora conica]|nr:hypothetical protein QBC39DRAFT_15633 [Schizothecium conicum]
MSTPTTFTLFPKLPAEIRLMIWEAALSVPSVWAALPIGFNNPNSSDGDTGPEPSGSAINDFDDTCDFDFDGGGFTMTFVGPAPSTIGQVSKEAWDVMRRFCGEPIRAPAGPAGEVRPCWVNLRHTVVSLVDPRVVMPSFDAGALSRFEHVVFNQRWPETYHGACKLLAAAYPALRTVIIHKCPIPARVVNSDSKRRGSCLISRRVPRRPPGQRSRVRRFEAIHSYARFVAYTGRQVPGFPTKTSPIFGAPRPRMYFTDMGWHER